jgi:hypothetical protein
MVKRGKTVAAAIKLRRLCHLLRTVVIAFNFIMVVFLFGIEGAKIIGDIIALHKTGNRLRPPDI